MGKGKRKVLRWVWICVGVVVAAILVAALIHAATLSASGFQAIGAGIAAGVFIALSLVLVLLYLVATGIFFLVRWIRRKKKKQRISKGDF